VGFFVFSFPLPQLSVVFPFFRRPAQTHDRHHKLTPRTLYGSYRRRLRRVPLLPPPPPPPPGGVRPASSALVGAAHASPL
jgi:hypothetical protein